VTAEIDGKTVHFEFSKFVGEGSFGLVYLFIDPLTSFQIAVKISKTN
jgi:serine/threonine protein kinase